MSETIKANNRLLRAILSRGLSWDEASALPELPEGVSLPLRSLGEMERLEERLENEATASAVVRLIQVTYPFIYKSKCFKNTLFFNTNSSK